jgi:hypothetical protein
MHPEGCARSLQNRPGSCPDPPPVRRGFQGRKNVSNGCKNCESARIQTHRWGLPFWCRTHNTTWTWNHVEAEFLGTLGFREQGAKQAFAEQPWTVGIKARVPEAPGGEVRPSLQSTGPPEDASGALGRTRLGKETRDRKSHKQRSIFEDGTEILSSC